MEGFFDKVYDIVAQIPKGTVTTYGQIALLLGEPRSARVVGWAMKAAPEELKLPCHRVVAKTGKVAPWGVFESPEIQKEMLLSEGITFNKDG
ncbi:MAG: MGMT family protein, partial [Bacillota bacterium]|nr:MGMT family protein [Bacillota bacterium]